MRSMFAVIAASIGFLLTVPSAASASETPAPKLSQCFFVNSFENWKAPDAKTIYIRVDLHRYYRLDLSASCPGLLRPNSHLITRWQGSGSVCSALDWNISVAQDFNGFQEGCIVKTMTALTADEAAAIPKKFKP